MKDTRRQAKTRVGYTAYMDQAGLFVALAALALLVVYAPSF